MGKGGFANLATYIDMIQIGSGGGAAPVPNSLVDRLKKLCKAWVYGLPSGCPFRAFFAAGHSVLIQ
jgi:hypothetical protein